MNNDICFLITLYYKANGTTLNCAIKVDGNTLPAGCAKYPMGEANREYFHALLPEHVSSCGPVVKVERIYEIHHVPVAKSKEKTLEFGE